MINIGVVDCGISNVGSVRNAFGFLGIKSEIVRAPKGLKNCSHLVLPGDGSFPVGMARLRELGLHRAITEAAHDGIPVLGICLGMQLMAEEGEEFGVTRGLGLTCGRVIRIRPNDPKLRVPQVGWNDVSFFRETQLGAGLGGNACFYFMQSYAFSDPSASAVAGVCDYGGAVVSVIEQGNIYGVQFHPEKSQHAGLSIMKNFAGVS
jgi:glutamine amidotransferase